MYDRGLSRRINGHNGWVVGGKRNTTDRMHGIVHGKYYLGCSSSSPRKSICKKEIMWGVVIGYSHTFNEYLVIKNLFEISCKLPKSILL